jgi:hypothetical protein
MALSILYHMFKPFCEDNESFYMIDHYNGIELFYIHSDNKKITFEEFHNMILKYIKDNHYENICELNKWKTINENRCLYPGDIFFINLINQNSEEFERIVTLFKLEGKI